MIEAQFGIQRGESLNSGDRYLNFTENYTYDTFGNILSQSGPSKGSLGFQSKYFDQESGLNYFYHRYYNSTSGIFTSEDPLGLNSTLNMYQFSNSNPIMFIDPSGLNAIALEVGWSIALGEPSLIGEAVMVVATVGYGAWYLLFSKTKEKGRSWITEEAKRRARQTPEKDICDHLAEMLKQAKCKGDKKLVMDIKQAQKYLNCRNVQKRRSN